MLAIRLPEDIERRLAALAAATGLGRSSKLTHFCRPKVDHL
jgi:predicted DNA-binding protein